MASMLRIGSAGFLPRRAGLSGASSVTCANAAVVCARVCERVAPGFGVSVSPYAALYRNFATSTKKTASSSTSSDPNIVPVIDLQPFFTGSADGKAKVAKAMNDACTHIGFLTVINHQVPKSTIDAMTKVTTEYFDLPVDQKRKGVEMTDEYPYGYSGYEEEKLSKGYGDGKALADLKECFAIGPYNPIAGMPTIRWPTKPANMQQVWLDYYKAIEVLSGNLLRVCALALNLPENWFEDKIDRHRSALRALNYPEQQKGPAPGQFRAGEHTDYGSLTILLQDSVGGLQVKAKDGQWKDIPYIEGSYIINLGDLMARWTNDKWVSTLHRVQHKFPRRQSIAFFHNINHDHLVTCIPTCTSPTNPPKYPPIKAWDHLIEKHTASVKY